MINLLESVAIEGRSGSAAEWLSATKFAEYAALGRPILVTDVDETANFVRNYRCGFVSDPHPANLAKTLSEASACPL